MSKRRRHPWADLDDEALLDVRLCDLKLTIPDTPLEHRLERLNDELAARGLRFRPHAWLSSEWFSPDGVPGIGIPFYLAHPRLARLEEKQMLEVEGGSEAQAMRILRHEAGHCIDTAYRLHRRKAWRETFGKYSTPYPASYRPRARSRDYVLHLRGWYAQAHPAEDFAETFAVWLTPRSRWRQQYATWPALAKLTFVDELMREIADQPAAVHNRQRVEPLSHLRMTLREHYRRKRRRYADDLPEVYDADLRRLFSDDPKYRGQPTAASFLRRIRPELRQRVADWSNTHPYTIDQVLGEMIDRCRKLKLRLARPPREARLEAMLMVTVQTMMFLHSGHYRVAL